MNKTNSKIESVPAKVNRWLRQAAEATISEEDLESLLRMCLLDCTSLEVAQDAQDGSLRPRLQAAINSCCHIVRISREYRDVDVDLETSRGLVAKRQRGEPFNDDDIRLLGKRSSNKEADKNLDSAFWSVVNFMEGLPLKQSAPFEVAPIQFYTTLSDEQFAILAASLFEQAVVQGTVGVTDKAWYAEGAAECPSLRRKMVIAHGISLLTERYDSALRYSKLSPEERTREDRAAEQLRRAIQGLPPDGSEGDSGAT